MDATAGEIHSQYDMNWITAARATIALLSKEHAAKICFAGFLNDTGDAAGADAAYELARDLSL